MSYERDGFVLQRKLLPLDVLGRLVAIGERVHAQWLREQGDDARRLDLVNSSGLTSPRYFAEPHRAERSSFFDALADPVLVDFATAVVGDGLYFHGTQMFFDPLGGRRQPYWHRDLQYMGWDEAEQRARLATLCNLHVRMPLRPERRFLLVPGSHARWDEALERDVRLEQGGRRSAEDLPSARAFDLDPGDVLIFSAHMLHRGTYGGNAERLSLDLMIGRPDPRVPVARDAEELPTSEELAGIRRPQWYERTLALSAAARLA